MQVLTLIGIPLQEQQPPAACGVRRCWSSATDLNKTTPLPPVMEVSPAPPLRNLASGGREKR